MTTSISGGTSSPTIMANGLISGLNTQQIIQAMMQSYLQPENNLLKEQSGLNTQVQDYQAINTDLLALQTAAKALSTSSGWGARQTSSSAATVATGSAAPGTPTGSVTFSVLQIAAANSLISAGSVSSTSDVVDSNPGFLLATGGAQFGFSSLSAGTGLTLGSHAIDVTQASQAASTTGTVSLGSQTSGISISSTNDTINVTINGTAQTLTIAASPTGGYSGAGLLSAIQSAISTAGASASLTAGYDASGNLILSSVDQGSSQSLQVTGGTALSTLGLAAMSTASVGADGLVSVDGKVNTLSTVVPGGSVSLTSGLGGSIGATLVPGTSQALVNSSLLSTGSLNATNVSTGNGSLASVVSNINAAGAGVSASAVQVGTNKYALELSSATTGVKGDLSVDTNAFAATSLGVLNVATAGADAKIQVGGSGGFTLTSPTDTFTGLLPGLSATVAAVSSNPVTLTVSPDATAAATQVQAMVTAADTALADIQKYAGYDAATKQAGPLMGSPLLQGLTGQILNVFGSAIGTSTLGNGQSVGITLSNGTINFNQSVFGTAFSSNPTQVANMFTQGGTFAPSQTGYAQQVALSYAGNSTKAGAYNVTVSNSATTATDLGAVLTTKSVSAAEQLTITMGGTSVSYATTAGETLANVAAGLDTALAGAGINMSAQVVNSGQQLQLTSGNYGSAATFQVTSTNVAAGTTGLAGGTANVAVGFAGTDVVGTINGVAATGQGQFLTAPGSDPTLNGLSLVVTATGITTSTSLGTFTYSPGMAQQLSSLASAMSDPSTGAVTATVQGLQNESTGLDPQISFYAALASREQTALQLLFSNLEVQLGSLKNQGAALTSALSNLG